MYQTCAPGISWKCHILKFFVNFDNSRHSMGHAMAERERESDGQMMTILFPENPMQRFFIARVQLCINLGDMNLLSYVLLQGFETITLQGTNISPKKWHF